MENNIIQNFYKTPTYKNYNSMTGFDQNLTVLASEIVLNYDKEDTDMQNTYKQFIYDYKNSFDKYNELFDEYKKTEDQSKFFYIKYLIDCAKKNREILSEREKEFIKLLLFEVETNNFNIANIHNFNHMIIGELDNIKNAFLKTTNSSDLKFKNFLQKKTVFSNILKGGLAFMLQIYDTQNDDTITKINTVSEIIKRTCPLPNSLIKIKINQKFIFSVNHKNNLYFPYLINIKKHNKLLLSERILKLQDIDKYFYITILKVLKKTKEIDIDITVENVDKRIEIDEKTSHNNNQQLDKKVENIKKEFLAFLKHPEIKHITYQDERRFRYFPKNYLLFFGFANDEDKVFFTLMQKVNIHGKETLQTAYQDTSFLKFLFNFHKKNQLTDIFYMKNTNSGLNLKTKLNFYKDFYPAQKQKNHEYDNYFYFPNISEEKNYYSVFSYEKLSTSIKSKEQLNNEIDNKNLEVFQQINDLDCLSIYLSNAVENICLEKNIEDLHADNLDICLVIPDNVKSKDRYIYRKYLKEKKIASNVTFINESELAINLIKNTSPQLEFPTNKVFFVITYNNDFSFTIAHFNSTTNNTNTYSVFTEKNFEKSLMMAVAKILKTKIENKLREKNNEYFFDNNSYQNRFNLEKQVENCISSLSFADETLIDFIHDDYENTSIRIYRKDILSDENIILLFRNLKANIEKTLNDFKEDISNSKIKFIFKQDLNEVFDFKDCILISNQKILRIFQLDTVKKYILPDSIKDKLKVSLFLKKFRETMTGINKEENINVFSSQLEKLYQNKQNNFWYYRNEDKYYANNSICILDDGTFPENKDIDKDIDTDNYDIKSISSLYLQSKDINIYKNFIYPSKVDRVKKNIRHYLTNIKNWFKELADNDDKSKLHFLQKSNDIDIEKIESLQNIIYNICLEKISEENIKEFISIRSLLKDFNDLIEVIVLDHTSKYSQTRDNFRQLNQSYQTIIDKNQSLLK